jgi:hypothetical protein
MFDSFGGDSERFNFLTRFSQKKETTISRLQKRNVGKKLGKKKKARYGRNEKCTQFFSLKAKENITH